MAKIESLIVCDGCGVEIYWAPVMKADKHYCCVDCRDGLKCNCSERMEFDDERRGSGSTYAEF